MNTEDNKSDVRSPLFVGRHTRRIFRNNWVRLPAVWGCRAERLVLSIARLECGVRFLLLKYADLSQPNQLSDGFLTETALTDSDGRLHIPLSLARLAELQGSELDLIGALDHIEVFAPRWRLVVDAEMADYAGEFTITDQQERHSDARWMRDDKQITRLQGLAANQACRLSPSSSCAPGIHRPPRGRSGT